jgi:dihydropteroate synthase
LPAVIRLVPIVPDLPLPADGTEQLRKVVKQTLALPAAAAPWSGYLAYDGERVIGTCAFKNAPAAGRPPEIAYFTFPPFEGRGYAAAMARELVLLAKAAGARCVVADTLPEANPSTRVLQKVGFHRAGVGLDDEVGRTWRWSLTLQTQVMGVVNVTPDSFSDGGLFLDPAVAVAHGRALAGAGADLLDIGGESTRPGAPEVGVNEELERVVPVIRALRGVTPELSVDTTKPEVAAAALEAGATMVNDVTGLKHSDALARLAARFDARLCVMHMQGDPRTMQKDPRYEDVVGEVLASLRTSVERALAAGVPRSRLVVDPGIGFGKTFDHNLTLLKHLGRLRELECTVLVGVSRKAFLGALTGGKPPLERDAATAAAVAVTSAIGTADIVRVHAVSEARDAAAVGDAVRCAR